MKSKMDIFSINLSLTFEAHGIKSYMPQATWHKLHSTLVKHKGWKGANKRRWKSRSRPRLSDYHGKKGLHIVCVLDKTY